MLDDLGGTHLQVVDTPRSLIHAKIYSTNVIKLIYMYFAIDSK